MKIGTCRSCAHSQNAKESSPSMKRPCQLEQISRPLNFNADRQRSPSAMWLLSKRVERAQAPVAGSARDDPGDAVVDCLANVEGRRLRHCGHHLGRERRRDDAAGDAGLGAGFLLQLEVPHLMIGDRRQPAIIGHRVLADRNAAQRLGDAEAVARRPRRRAMRVDVDDRHRAGYRPHLPPQTWSATSTMRASFRSTTSSGKVPVPTLLEKPHCGHSARLIDVDRTAGFLDPTLEHIGRFNFGILGGHDADGNTLALGHKAQRLEIAGAGCRIREDSRPL